MQRPGYRTAPRFLITMAVLIHWHLLDVTVMAVPFSYRSVNRMPTRFVGTKVTYARSHFIEEQYSAEGDDKIRKSTIEEMKMPIEILVPPVNAQPVTLWANGFNTKT